MSTKFELSSIFCKAGKVASKSLLTQEISNAAFDLIPAMRATSALLDMLFISLVDVIYKKLISASRTEKVDIQSSVCGKLLSLELIDQS